MNQTEANSAQTGSGNGMSQGFLETASYWSNVLAVAFGILAALSAALALFFGAKVGTIKDAALERFQSDSTTAIGSANERAKKLESETAEQRERAARAERDLLELQKSAAPRRLTKAQRLAFVDRIKDKNGKLVVVSILLDGESSDFADDLDSALHEAHWETLRVKNWIGSGFGVSVGWADGTPESNLKSLKEFAAILSEVGIATDHCVFKPGDASMSPHVEPNVAYLVVAHKPPPKGKPE